MLTYFGYTFSITMVINFLQYIRVTSVSYPDQHESALLYSMEGLLDPDLGMQFRNDPGGNTNTDLR